MSVAALLAEAEAAGVTFYLAEGSLRYRGELPEPLFRQLWAQREAVRKMVARLHWQDLDAAKQGNLSPGRLVFVDETGAATNMARRYGRSPCGRRLDGPIPHGHWKATTFVGGLTARGFVAPYVLDGPMNGAIFRAWIEQMLAPELRPGDIVIMDNLAAHKVAGIAKAIADRGAELRFLPGIMEQSHQTGGWS